MKKIILWTMILTMLLALCACGKKKEVILVGRLNDGFDHSAADKHIEEKHPGAAGAPCEWQVYDNLSAALLALEKGEIRSLTLNSRVAEYVIAHNETFTIRESTLMPKDGIAHDFSMLTAAQNTELYAILDGAIKQLKADGTLEQLIAEHLTAYVANDPIPAALPHFEGAPTYRIAVTGDMPPMDFVTADGHAAGFNVALLSAIANIAQVNLETVHIDTGARTTALASGAVDAVFWTTTYHCGCGEFIDGAPDGTVLTEAYFSDSVSLVVLK